MIEPLSLQELDALRNQSKEHGANMALYRNPKSEWYKRAVAGGMTPEKINAEAATLQKTLNKIKIDIRNFEEEEKQVKVDYYNDTLYADWAALDVRRR